MASYCISKLATPNLFLTQYTLIIQLVFKSLPFPSIARVLHNVRWPLTPLCVSHQGQVREACEGGLASETMDK